MKILFKSDYKVFGINYDNNLSWNYIKNNDDDLTNISHLKDAEVLYHYRDTKSGKIYPVYYEHNNIFISFSAYEYLILDADNYNKDHTLVNLKII